MANKAMQNLVESKDVEIFERFRGKMPERQLDDVFHISPANRYIYVNVPKTACSTVKASLWLNEQVAAGKAPSVPTLGKELHNKKLSPLLSPSDLPAEEFFRRLEDDYKFCFVRNPYTRILSCYLDKIVRGTGEKAQILRVLGMDPAELKANISFDAFVDVLYQQKSFEMDPHWRVQTDQCLYDNIEYDLVGRFESFEKDLTSVLSLLFEHPADKPVVHIPHATSADSKLNAYYTGSTADKVYARYQSDFEIFRYSRHIDQ